MKDTLQITNTKRSIKDMIFEIRGVQVIIDSDVALLYGYEVKQLNRVVKRNIERFPEEYCFQLTKEEYYFLRCQFGTSKTKEETRGGRQYFPYVFTEHGITMLAGLLRSKTAIEMSINIVNTFIEMKNFFYRNKDIINRLTTVEYKTLENRKDIDVMFSKLNKKKDFKEKIFYKGQIYDAYSLLVDIIKQSKKEIIIIDNYINKNTLDILSNKKENVKIILVTNTKATIKNIDIEKYKEQYGNIKIIINNNFHDRFIIIDRKALYHCGASVKDLGKRCFGINKVEDEKYLITTLKELQSI